MSKRPGGPGIRASAGCPSAQGADGGSLSGATSVNVMCSKEAADLRLPVEVVQQMVQV